jgi:hypothetical protein
MTNRVGIRRYLLQRVSLGKILLVLFGLNMPMMEAQAPRPDSFFGHTMGADKSTFEWSRVLRYFESLDDNSDRVVVRKIGKTTLGRDMIAAFVAAPDVIQNLDQQRALHQILADPRNAAQPDIERTVLQAKTVVLITCAIHSTEMASTHSAIEFAYRMATATDAKTEEILKNVIFILVPSLNPDGTDLVTKWYRKTLNTPFEGKGPPELYQKYLGHDNNRDWYLFSQAETRNLVGQIHNVWHPQIVYDLHEQGPYGARMFVPPYLDPLEPNIDPILSQLTNAVGTNIAFDLTAAGRLGVAINAVYDLWTPARSYQSFHGGIRILSESATTRLASPIQIKPEEVQQRGNGYSPRQSTWNFLQPWNGGLWRLRDNVENQLIAMESVLYQAAIRREDLNRAFLKVGRNAISRGTKAGTGPFAFTIRRDQRDPGALSTLLETLAFGGVEIEELTEGFSQGSAALTAGTFIIRMQQPYSSFAKALLEKQTYPDLRQYPGGPPKRPYDVTAHTLPLLMGVEIGHLDYAGILRTKPARFGRDLSTRGTLSASDTNSWRAVFRAWKDGKKVWRDPNSGDFAIRDQGPEGWNLKLAPRVGVYQSFVPSMDEGWTRWIFDHLGFSYRTVKNPDVLGGNLKAKYDVLIFPDQSPKSIREGFESGSMPAEYVGGLGENGAAELKRFAEEGGRIIFLNESSQYGIEALSLPIKTVSASPQELYCPGSLLKVSANGPHPLLLGLPASFTIWNEDSPAFTESSSENVKEIVRYSENDLLASGWLLGDKLLAGKSPLLQVGLGKGQVLLFGMRPQYRGQSYLTFKLLFNALAM